jgi:hypothetical protein
MTLSLVLRRGTIIDSPSSRCRLCLCVEWRKCMGGNRYHQSLGRCQKIRIWSFSRSIWRQNRGRNLRRTAYVYTRSSGPDSFTGTALLQGDTTGDDFFGYQVAIVGDTAVVGAPFHDNENGAAYVFKRDPADESWSQATKLTSSVSNGERLGDSVAISGDFVVAGAQFSTFLPEMLEHFLSLRIPPARPNQAEVTRGDSG